MPLSPAARSRLQWKSGRSGEPPTRDLPALTAEEMTVQISAPQSAQFSRLQAARPQLLDSRLNGGSGTPTQGPQGAPPLPLSVGEGGRADSSFFVVTAFSQCWPPWSGQLGAGPAAGCSAKQWLRPNRHTATLPLSSRVWGASQ